MRSFPIHAASAYRLLRGGTFALALTGMPCVFAQNANSPASVPAGALTPLPAMSPLPVIETPASPTPKQLKEAEDAYLSGVKQLERKDMAAAEGSLQHAVRLSPGNKDYALAFVIAREGLIAQLVREAAVARSRGETVQAAELLEGARKLDPDNQVIAQHFPGDLTEAETRAAKPYRNPSTIAGEEVAPTLAGTFLLEPKAGTQSYHAGVDGMTLVRNVYGSFGITAVFDPSVSQGPSTQVDLDNLSFAEATRIANRMAHTFAVVLQPKQVLIVRDTQELRDQYQQQVEETVYTPGLASEQITELATIARNIFDLKQVTASATGGTILLRGEPDVLNQVNAVYADMLDGGSDVLFDVNLYELSRTNTRNLGTQLPTSAGVFSITALAQQLVNQNQTILQQIIASGQLKLTGNYFTDVLLEAGALVLYGGVSAPQLTNLLGTLGSLGGFPLAGIFLGSTTTFTALLSSSDTRILDAVQVRSSNGQPVNFRAGSRYPIITASYSSGVSSALSSQLSGLKINGTSVGSLLSQYLGTSSTVPQFQFEDLGITLKLTPRIQNSNEVQVALEMKVESLAGGAINNVPVLNNRAITSTLSIPAGKTAMLATLVSKSELRSVSGVPGISELFSYAGGEQSTEKDSDELLITITPHIVRQGQLRIASRPLIAAKTTSQPNAQ